MLGASDPNALRNVSISAACSPFIVKRRMRRPVANGIPRSRATMRTIRQGAQVRTQLRHGRRTHAERFRGKGFFRLTARAISRSIHRARKGFPSVSGSRASYAAPLALRLAQSGPNRKGSIPSCASNCKRILDVVTTV